MILLALTILVTICGLLSALCVFVALLAHPKGGLNRAVGSVLLYPMPPLVMMWVLYGMLP